MGIALTEEQQDLAASVRDFTAREAPVAKTRAAFAELADGVLPAVWESVRVQGYLGIHLPEAAGGDGGGVTELAVLLEEAARGLLPGPLLPTVLTSLAVARFGPAELLPAFVNGAPAGCVTTPDGLTAVGTADGWQVSGTSAPGPGVVSGEFLLLGAQGPDGAIWFVTPSGPDRAGTLKTEKAEGVDLTRDIGSVTLAGHHVPTGHVLAVETHELRSLMAVLFAAEAVGVARWCQQAGLEYVKVREQFDRPVGSFQAIKHKCARIFGKVEILSAAAWDAASAVAQDGDQRAFAAAAAAVTCLPTVVELALDTVTLFGGIGFTWEHDTHLYWRRAISLASLLGPASAWEERLGELAVTVTRVRELELDEPAGVREQIAGVLAQAQAAPEADRRRLLGDAGLVSPHYPRPYGLAADAVTQVIISQEFERAGLVQPSTIIGEWTLPTILAHGTEVQRERFIQPTLRGEIDWCQLFSEPGAGSDLASLRTRAEKTEGGWLINGQKVWNSNAQHADWAICLARTDADVPKHKGISYFLVDMHAPGIDVRPLREATGHYLFNEVFLDNVFVPDEMLVGAPGDGWRLARTTLGNERVSIGSGMTGPAEPPAHIAARLGASGPTVTRDVGRLTAWRNAADSLARRGLLQRLQGSSPGAEASVLKLESSLVTAEVARTVLTWVGPAGAVTIEKGAAQTYLAIPAQLIGGGTAEIQLNVIAERVLGLPRGSSA
jgi:alkylation response protein AidB-like acyl-CoA dehydrogenase